jgi:hypothetical protein
MSKIVLKEYIRDPINVITDENGITYIRGQLVTEKATFTRGEFQKEIEVEAFKPTRGPKIGVLVALDDGRWGWSLISPHEKLNDVLTDDYVINFEHDGKRKTKTITAKKPVWTADRVWEYGTRLAVERATGEQPTPKFIPAIAKPSIKKFEKRIQAYFKK